MVYREAENAHGGRGVSLAGKSILVCGAAGFIGRNLVQDLARDSKTEIYAVIHNKPAPQEWTSFKNIRLIKADLRKPQDSVRIVNGMDIVIQAAASTTGFKHTFTRPHCHITDNTIMNSLLLKSAFEAGVGHFVFLSCSVMYPTSVRPVKETDFNGEIVNKYFGGGWYKVYIEKMCEFYSRLGKTKFMAIRHSNVYGPFDKYDLERSHVFGATVTKVMTATTGKVSVWGDGSETRDLIYVDDLLRFIHLALEKQKESFDLVNVGAGEGVSIANLVRKIIHLAGLKLSIVFDKTSPAAPFHLTLDCTKAKLVYGWESCISLDEGIRKTLEWYQAYYKQSGRKKSVLGSQ